MLNLVNITHLLPEQCAYPIKKRSHSMYNTYHFCLLPEKQISQGSRSLTLIIPSALCCWAIEQGDPQKTSYHPDIENGNQATHMRKTVARLFAVIYTVENRQWQRSKRVSIMRQLQRNGVIILIAVINEGRNRAGVDTGGCVVILVNVKTSIVNEWFKRLEAGSTRRGANRPYLGSYLKTTEPWINLLVLLKILYCCDNKNILTIWRLHLCCRVDRTHADITTQYNRQLRTLFDTRNSISALNTCSVVLII